jgi:hypothetical protein
MKDYIKKYIKTIRLNSFHPLCETEIGQNAIKEFNFLPFIDAFIKPIIAKKKKKSFVFLIKFIFI